MDNWPFEIICKYDIVKDVYYCKVQSYVIPVYNTHVNNVFINGKLGYSKGLIDKKLKTIKNITDATVIGLQTI